MPKKTIKAPAAGDPVGPYSKAVMVGDWIFVSGEAGVDPKTGGIVQGGVRAQTRQALNNIQAILEVAGSRLDDVIRCVVYMADTEDLEGMNEAYAEFFPKDPPARSIVIVAALPRGPQILIEATAVKGSGRS